MRDWEIMDKAELILVKPYVDSRGMLLKIFRHSQLREGNVGEIYVLYTNPGCIRGNHYHKLTLEYFAVLSGAASIALKNIDTGDLEMMELTAWDNRILKVPPGIAHALKNETELPLIILAVSTREYDEHDPDTYMAEIYL